MYRERMSKCILKHYMFFKAQCTYDINALNE